MSQHAGDPGRVPPPGPVPDEAATGPHPVGADTSGSRAAQGPVRVLALVATGIALLIYLLGFGAELSVSNSFAGPLLISGGLLAGTAVLPRSGRVLGPAAVLIGTGTLMLLQFVAAIGGPVVAIVALVLAVLQTAAVVGALLLDSGVVTAAALDRPGRTRGGPLGHGGFARGPGAPAQGAPGPGATPSGFGRPVDGPVPPQSWGPPPGPGPGPGQPEQRPTPWYLGPDRTGNRTEHPPWAPPPAPAETTDLFTKVPDPPKPDGPAAEPGAAGDPTTGRHLRPDRPDRPDDAAETQVIRSEDLSGRTDRPDGDEPAPPRRPEG